MLRQTKRNRLMVNSWYIGAGNRLSVFTRKSSQPFEKMKEIFGEDMNRLHAESNEGNSDKEKNAKVIRQVDSTQRNYLYTFSFLLIIVVIVLLITFYKRTLS